MREPLSPIERLCIAGRIISETCKAIWDELINKGYLDHPKSEHDWLKVAQELRTARIFLTRWEQEMENMLSCKLQHDQGLTFLITRKHTALF